MRGIWATISEEEVSTIVLGASSIADVAKKLGLKPIGGNYKTIKRHIERLGLSIDHFTGQGWLKGKTHGFAKKIPLEEILVDGSNYASDKLKKRLLKAGLMVYQCRECGLSEWNGKPISLELEHRNGNSRDNRIENVELLCPNCHSQTTTWRGRNIKGA